MGLEFLARRLDLVVQEQQTLSCLLIRNVQAFRHRFIYFISAGIAGVDPEVATIGSVTFARFPVYINKSNSSTKFLRKCLTGKKSSQAKTKRLEKEIHCMARHFVLLHSGTLAELVC